MTSGVRSCPQRWVGFVSADDDAPASSDRCRVQRQILCWLASGKAIRGIGNQKIAPQFGHLNFPSPRQMSPVERSAMNFGMRLPRPGLEHFAQFMTHLQRLGSRLYCGFRTMKGLRRKEHFCCTPPLRKTHPRHCKTAQKH